MKNVIYDDGTKLKPDHYTYTFSIIKHLRRLLPNFDDYLFIVYNTIGTTLPISRNFKHDKKILFFEAGEKRQQPFDSIKHDYSLIFSTHTYSRENIFSMPLGYWDDRVIGNVIPMEERYYDISFSGCLNRNRVHLAHLLSGKSKEWIGVGVHKRQNKTIKTLNQIVQWRWTNDYFNFTEDFGKGMEKDRYSYVLRNSRIVLSPRGFSSTECFRMYEAMMHGCVVISENLPDRDYYNGIPVIQVKTWKEGLNIARDLLTDDFSVNEIGAANRRFYNEHFHPRSVAKWASKIIQQRC